MAILFNATLKFNKWWLLKGPLQYGIQKQVSEYFVF